VKSVESNRWLIGAIVALVLAMPVMAHAQVVVVANGSPITEFDIQQRTKLEASSTHKSPTRQQIINDLIDDRLKIARARVYGLEVGDAEVNSAFEGMATRQRITPAQFAQVLERAGISQNAVKARIRAELTWQQLIRGKYNSSLQVGESDIASALKDRNENDAAAVGYTYTLYPVMIVVARGSSEGVVTAGSPPAMKALLWRAACATWRCAIRSHETPQT
jgi:peptidyl-prolyl cis-trans isomerase SurA